MEAYKLALHYTEAEKGQREQPTKPRAADKKTRSCAVPTLTQQYNAHARGHV